MLRLINRFGDGSPPSVAMTTTGLVFVIGLLDYLSGSEISLSAVYVLPIAIAAWHRDFLFASVVSVFSVAVWVLGDFVSGYTASSWPVMVWNILIRLVFYYVVIQLLLYIRSLTLSLEHHVEERTAQLRSEMAERQRLEREVREVSARERSRLGYDLHDGLCQHLTGTALVVQVLKEKLARRELPEAADAAGAVELIEDGIAIARNLANGLQPVELHSGGLMQALQEFAASTKDMFNVSCRFECETPVIIANSSVADHLYHIAREATGNAAKHSRAQNIVITLDASEEGTTMSVLDDGVGIPDTLPRSGGLGLRNMVQRAQLIGAKLDIRPGVTRGTMISCSLPASLA